MSIPINTDVNIISSASYFSNCALELKAEEKKMIQRKKNPEENGFWFLNVCYCFFLPFVCRKKPVTDEDIPDADTRDSCTRNFDLVEKRWVKRYKKYLDQKLEYDLQKEKLPEFNLK
jgi:hypothetical protein